MIIDILNVMRKKRFQRGDRHPTRPRLVFHRYLDRKPYWVTRAELERIRAREYFRKHYFEVVDSPAPEIGHTFCNYLKWNPTDSLEWRTK